MPIASVYPVAVARAPIRRTVLPNSRLVGWLSASISQQCRACLTNLPPVFTSLHCKLVGDQFSIFFGNTRPRSEGTRRPGQRFPRFSGWTVAGLADLRRQRGVYIPAVGDNDLADAASPMLHRRLAASLASDPFVIGRLSRRTLLEQAKAKAPAQCRFACPSPI